MASHTKNKSFLDQTVLLIAVSRNEHLILKSFLKNILVMKQISLTLMVSLNAFSVSKSTMVIDRKNMSQMYFTQKYFPSSRDRDANFKSQESQTKKMVIADNTLRQAGWVGRQAYRRADGRSCRLCLCYAGRCLSQFCVVDFRVIVVLLDMCFYFVVGDLFVLATSVLFPGLGLISISVI